MKPAIYFGGVMHTRLRPRRNAFRYRVFFMRLPLSRLERIRSPLFSVNRWNLFSFHYCDHGARDGSPPEPWIRQLLAREGVETADGEVVLHPWSDVRVAPCAEWSCDRGRVGAAIEQVQQSGDLHAGHAHAAADST